MYILKTSTNYFQIQTNDSLIRRFNPSKLLNKIVFLNDKQSYKTRNIPSKTFNLK